MALMALTGSDTASNVLFGGMPKVAAEPLGLSPTLMGAASHALAAALQAAALVAPRSSRRIHAASCVLAWSG